MNEQQLIERYFIRPQADAGVAAGLVVGIGDDAAVIDCGAGTGSAGTGQMVVTADTLVEGRHFSVDAAAEDVGYKTLAVGLSDLAAMGAVPHWATLCLSLPQIDDAQTESWLAGFARGFFTLAKQWDVSLIGGDLVCGARTITAQLTGSVEASQALLRSNAQPGDGIYLTGSVGDAGFAHRCSDRGDQLPADVSMRLHRPAPRVAEGRMLVGFASAAIDVSDGLLCDLSRLAQASEVSMQVAIDKVPLGKGCRPHCREPSDWALPLTDGDDYELLFTMDDEHLPALEQALATQSASVGVTRIGQVVSKGEACLQCRFEGRAWRLPEKLGYDHFENNFL